MISRTILTPYFLDQYLPGLEELKEPEWIINRYNIPHSDQQNRMSVLHAALAINVEDALNQSLLPISIAGDCCTAIGMLAGFQRAGVNPLLIWFDAHGDFNTWETTPSGFLGGMPLAMLAGLGDQTFLDNLNVQPLHKEQIILTDGRDLDPGEKELIANSRINHLQDPLDLIKMSLPKGPLWVHFDTDVVNVEESPAQNYPAPGGPSEEELSQVFRYLDNTGLIRAISISSWNPELEGAGQSESISLRLLDILSGRRNL